MVLTRQGFLGYQVDTKELMSAVIGRIQSPFPLTSQQLTELFAIANYPLSHIDRLRERIHALNITSKVRLLALCQRNDRYGEDALQIVTCALSLNANPLSAVMGKETNSRRSLLRTINDELLHLHYELARTSAQSARVRPPMSPEEIQEMKRDEAAAVARKIIIDAEGENSEAYKYLLEQQNQSALNAREQKMRRTLEADENRMWGTLKADENRMRRLLEEQEEELRRRAGLPPKRG